MSFVIEPIKHRMRYQRDQRSLRRPNVGKILIKNLDENIDNKALHDIFSAFGNILSCKIAMDENDISKGFGYVHFETQEAADQAIEKVNGMLLNDKKLDVIKLRKIQDFSENFKDPNRRKRSQPFGGLHDMKMMQTEDGHSKGLVNSPSFAKADSASPGVAQKKFEREAEIPSYFPQQKMRKVNQFQSNFNQSLYLRIKNLDETIDDTQLREVFECYGAITSATVKKDENGNSNGWVLFQSSKEAKKAATEMNGQILMSNKITVALVQRKRESQGQLVPEYMQRAAGSMIAQETQPVGQMFSNTRMISPGKGNDEPNVQPSAQPKFAYRKSIAVPANSSAKPVPVKESLRSRVLKKIADLEQQRGKSNKPLEQLFASNNVVSRPTRFTKCLFQYLDSIGYLKCGTVHATCFLVSEDMVVTNMHVVDNILKARKSSTPEDHSEIYVCFCFEGSNFPRNDYKLKPLTFDKNILCRQLDYAFLHLQNHVQKETAKLKPLNFGKGVLFGRQLEYPFFHLQNPVQKETVKTLGQLVSCNVPEQGKICIVGHPNGKEKQEEMCAIIPLSENTRGWELDKRFRESELQCKNNKSSCALAYIGQTSQTCAHSHQSALQQVCSEDKALTYDVGSMFEGASGAPVFDMKCNIVALHTGGFRVRETSIVEYGITFDAIIRHLKGNGHTNFVREHFPSCLNEDMPDEDILNVL